MEVSGSEEESVFNVLSPAGASFPHRSTQYLKSEREASLLRHTLFFFAFAFHDSRNWYEHKVICFLT